MAHPSPQLDLFRNRLPTLFEVLSRRTLPPVDLFTFYTYMRDQQKSVDYLDFWYVASSSLLHLPFASLGQVTEPVCKARCDSTQEPHEFSRSVDEAHSRRPSQERVRASGTHPVAGPSTTPPVDTRDMDEQVRDIFLRGGGLKSRTRDVQEHIAAYLRGDGCESPPPRNRTSHERVQRPSSILHTRPSSSIFERLGDMNNPAAGPAMYATDRERGQDARMSAFLREDGGSPGP